MEVTGSEELRKFLDSWQDDPLNIKKSFTEYMDFLAAHSNISFTFKARPGVSYSLRRATAYRPNAYSLCCWRWWMMYRQAAGFPFVFMTKWSLTPAKRATLCPVASWAKTPLL